MDDLFINLKNIIEEHEKQDAKKFYNLEKLKKNEQKRKINYMEDLKELKKAIKHHRKMNCKTKNYLQHIYNTKKIELYLFKIQNLKIESL